MKLKYDFIINELGDEFVAVPVGDFVVDFNGILKLNQTAATIVEMLKEDISYEDLCYKLSNKYQVSIEEAERNVDKMLDGLKGANLIVE